MANPKYGCRLPQEVYDTLYRMKRDTMVDASKLVTKALKEFFEKNNFELRVNTEEENQEIFGK